MFVCSFTSLLVWLFVYLFVSLVVHLSVCLFVCLFVCSVDDICDNCSCDNFEIFCPRKAWWGKSSLASLAGAPHNGFHGFCSVIVFSRAALDNSALVVCCAVLFAVSLAGAMHWGIAGFFAPGPGGGSLPLLLWLGFPTMDSTVFALW